MTERNEPNKKKLSLHPLDFETALADLLQTGPHPKATVGQQERPQGRRRRGKRRLRGAKTPKQ